VAPGGAGCAQAKDAEGAVAAHAREAAEAWRAGAEQGTIRNRSGDRYKPSALRGYEQALRTRVLPDLGGARLSDVTRADLQDLADRLVGEGLDASTIRNAFLPVRAIFRRAVARGEVAVNPTAGLELPAVRGRRDRIASAVEAEQLLAALPVGERALWATAFYAGLRLGEPPELGAAIELASLPAGDYAVGADTLVERKRVLDLHGAVLKGRLWPQLALRAACAFPYLLVEGTDIDRGPLHHNAIRGACLAAIDHGIALLRSGYQRDSALWIHRLAERCQEVEPAAERPAYAQRPRPKPGNETAERLLAAVPGISTASARALLVKFGSVAAVVAADPAEWLTVPGIGRGRARALEETFTLPRSPLAAADDRSQPLSSAVSSE